MIVVNLFGVPGAGKSTGAAYVFSKLKMQGINAELVRVGIKHTDNTKRKCIQDIPSQDTDYDLEQSPFVSSHHPP